jgi:hypothetical protein
VVRQDAELPAFKDETEVANGGENGQQLSVKCRIF